MFTADTIADVVAHVMTAATFTVAVKNIMWNSPFNSSHIDDVKQDLTIYLIENEEKTIEAAKKGELFYYFLGIAKRQLQSKKSKLFGRYVNHRNEAQQEAFDECLHDFDSEEQPDWVEKEHINFCVDEMMKLINRFINTNQDLKRNLELLKMNFFEGFTYRQINERTGIPLSRIHQYISEAKQWLRNNTRFDLFID